jgi:hypothetical protein
MMAMEAVGADQNLAVFCGPYCGACKAPLKGKGAGCRESAKPAWCAEMAAARRHTMRPA